MTEDEFTHKLTELIQSKPASPGDSPLEDIVSTFVREVVARGKGVWSNDNAKQVMTEFEWLLRQN